MRFVAFVLSCRSFFFFKQKTAYEIRPRDWSSDVCSSDLWGTDALFRRGLALELPSVEVVFWEHLLLVLFTLPLIVRGLRTLQGRPWRDWAAIAVVGGGSSVAATVLLTEAFQHGDPTTPLLLQKLQPVIVALLAAALLGERLRPRYFAYLAAAL